MIFNLIGNDNNNFSVIYPYTWDWIIDVYFIYNRLNHMYLLILY